MSALQALRRALSALEGAEILIGDHRVVPAWMLNAIDDARTAIEADVEAVLAERGEWVTLIARIGTLVNCLYSVTPIGNEHIVKSIERLVAGFPPSATVYPPDGTVSPFTVINLGSGAVQMGDSVHDGRLPALWFGKGGTGMGLEQAMDRQAHEGETIAVVTFANIAGLDVLLEVLHRIRRDAFPPAVQEWVRDDESVFCTLMLCGGHSVSREAITAWSDDQCRQAQEWAITEHVAASDNDDVVRLPMPDHVKAHPPKPFDANDIGDLWS